MTGLAVGYNDIFLHHCMFGSERKKLTRLRANFEQLTVIGVRCNGQHIHAKWGLVKSKWATSLEVEYPHALCKAWARVFVDTILALGAVSPPLQLSELPEHSLRQSQAATFKQPRGKRLPPLVREYKQVCVLTGPVSDMWQPVISSDWKIPATLQCKPSQSVIPAGSKLLRSQIHGGNCERAEKSECFIPRLKENAAEKSECFIPRLKENAADPQHTVECAIGIPWEPWEFIEQAKRPWTPQTVCPWSSKTPGTNNTVDRWRDSM